MFYETIDSVFDNLYEKYGLSEELVECKEKILYAYENGDKCYTDALAKKLQVKNFMIDENGCVKAC